MPKIKYKRLSPGCYQSLDGSIIIQKVQSVQTKRATEHLWGIYIHGHPQPKCSNTLKDAKERVLYIVNRANEILRELELK